MAYISSEKHCQIHSVNNWKEVKAGNLKIRRNYNKLDISDDDIRKMQKDGIPVKEMAEILNCHPNTIYRRMEKWKGDNY